MTDESAIQYNRERWEALARHRVLFSRPWLDLDERSARERLGVPLDIDIDVSKKTVLCLASGGGQQSAALAILGANVTVLDFSETQLERDHEAAAHYGHRITTILGDMQDLSSFGENEFDFVWQPFSINYVKEAGVVIREAARVLRNGGSYCLDFANPFAMGSDERAWNGEAYPLRRFYVEGELIEPDQAEWEIWNEGGTCRALVGPKQFRHTFSTIVNSLSGNGFTIRRLWESAGDPTAPPGTWDHFTAIAPQIIGVW